ncbi:hypothetical protein Barb6XT_00152 [Bacteroidales bacterium Barb6XT]|nr:hypothetical protein Barb6XT_00152 [Bacteroidales bacterium Barb6XT]
MCNPHNPLGLILSLAQTVSSSADLPALFSFYSKLEGANEHPCGSYDNTNDSYDHPRSPYYNPCGSYYNTRYSYDNPNASHDHPRGSYDNTNDLYDNPRGSYDHLH